MLKQSMYILNKWNQCYVDQQPIGNVKIYMNEFDG